MNLFFLNIEDISKITGFQYSKAGGIIRGLNAELKKKGIVTHQGIVNAEYFAERHGLTFEYIKKYLKRRQPQQVQTKNNVNLIVLHF